MRAHSRKSALDDTDVTFGDFLMIVSIMCTLMPDKKMSSKMGKEIGRKKGISQKVAFFNVGPARSRSASASRSSSGLSQ